MEKVSRKSKQGAEKSKHGAESKNQQQGARQKKLSEYGRQLEEKQKVKRMYGMRERQFHRFFEEAARSQEATGDYLLSLLERRLDNVVYRLKFASSRTQARQIIVHGHITVNKKRVSSPSFIVSLNDVIALSEPISRRESFMEAVVAKRMKKAIKPPEWLELDKDGTHGTVLRYPVRSDIKVPIEDHYIIELYSK